LHKLAISELPYTDVALKPGGDDMRLSYYDAIDALLVRKWRRCEVVPLERRE
jgi:hypothetical protein